MPFLKYTPGPKHGSSLGAQGYFLELGLSYVPL